MPPDIRDALGARALLFDGAMGTMLLGRGLERGTPVARWVLERPDAVAEVHRAHAAAGADIVTTSTFDSGRPRLEAVGLGGQFGDVQTRAVALAREAAGAQRWVAGDLSASAARNPRTPIADAGALRTEFGEQARALAGAGADLLLIETMYDLAEARIALACGLETGLPVFVSMTFGTPEDAESILSFAGDHPAEAAQVLSRDGAHAVGANCTLPPGPMRAIAHELLAGATTPVFVQPNAGQPLADATGRFSYGATPDEFAEAAVALVRDGVQLVGGCCGTTPDHIAAMRRALDEA